jgi:hypothetical protein
MPGGVAGDAKAQPSRPYADRFFMLCFQCVANDSFAGSARTDEPLCVTTQGGNCVP